MLITKDERQNIILNNWEKHNYLGVTLCPTGFGKTMTAIKGIKRLLYKGLISKGVIIIVPTNVLKLQWEERLAHANLLPYCKVIIVNSAYKHEFVCDLLILDEAHFIPAKEFRKCLDTIQYKYVLCLTATIHRADKEERLLLDKFPICDEVTLKECLANKWISEYIIYNIPVPFSFDEYTAYKKADNSFKYYTSRCINFDFSNPFECAENWLKNGDNKQKSYAAGYFRNMIIRKDLLFNNSNKLNYTIEIINKFPDRLGLVFSESIAFANKLYQQLPEVCLPIHSKIKNKQQQEQLELFKSRNTSQRIISSCKSLVSGLDIPELSLGIITSASSSRIVSAQSLGRLLRVQDDKQAIVVNLYTPDYEEVKSQEVKWLIKRQQNLSNINWINSIDEII